MTEETERRIQAAIDAVAAAGRRPSIRSVREQMLATDGTGCSYRDIVPVLSRWRAEVHQSKRVRDAAKAYLALDAEERAGFDAMLAKRGVKA